MKIVVNPEYAYLSDFINKVSTEEFIYESLIRNDRNTITKATVNGCTMVIKQYKRPTLFNCFVYSFLRKSKARRSYEYAFRLKELGVGTADPIAYIEKKKNGFFHTGFFISLYLPYPQVDMLDRYDKDIADKVLDDFIEFTVRTHEKGVMHRDYNLSNILFHKEEGEDSYRFDLIDINRMKFNRFSEKHCLRVLKVMGLELPVFTAFGERYATLRGWNTEIFCGKLMLARGYNNRQRRRNEKMKSLYKKRKKTSA